MAILNSNIMQLVNNKKRVSNLYVGGTLLHAQAKLIFPRATVRDDVFVMFPIPFGAKINDLFIILRAGTFGAHDHQLGVVIPASGEFYPINEMFSGGTTGQLKTVVPFVPLSKAVLEETPDVNPKIFENNTVYLSIKFDGATIGNGQVVTAQATYVYGGTSAAQGGYLSPDDATAVW